MAWSTSFTKDEEKDNEILLEAKKRFKICEEWEAQARVWFEYDYKFANADSNNMYQWDNWVVGDRQQNQRPCLTINKTMQHNLQIINDGKQNKPGVAIRPVGDTASFEAAQVFQEVVRHIEYVSTAESVYDFASVYQVCAGWGYWRVTVEKINGTFDKEIYIRRIKNPLNVYLDPNINEIDGSDAWFGFVFDDMPKDLYEAQYPRDKDVGNIAFADNDYGWLSKERVRVAEYFRKSQEPDKLVYFITPNAGEEIGPIKWSELPKDGREMFNAIKAREGNLPPEERTYQEQDELSEKIEWYKIAGNRIIDRKPWLGKFIPIVRCVGTETIIDGIWDCKGHTRALLDPQRIYNINSPLALDTPLPTPNGWTTMGEVKAGDLLFDENGKPVEVVSTSPVFINRECYKVTFDDNSSIIADANHLWTVEEREKVKTYNWSWLVKTIPTKELTPNKHFIYATKPFDLEEKTLLIEPYVLGAWLGDGTTASAQFTVGAEDLEEMRANIENCGYSVAQDRVCKYGAYNFTVHGLRWQLSELGLLSGKYIPKDYLRASFEQRLELLQGMMDTDGCYSDRFNRCVFSNTNLVLIEGFIELIRSLGLRFTKNEIAANSRKFPNGETYFCQPSVQISFTADPWLPIFKLKRKAELQTKHRIVHERRSKRHKIKSVVRIASIPVKCVAINSASHLFLAGEGMVPTHNSANVEFGALQTKTPIAASPEAMEGYEAIYARANIDNLSVLPYNEYDEEGRKLNPPTRIPAPVSSPAYVQQMQIAQNEMMMVSGQYQAQMGENENAKSGIAIDRRQRQGDRATYHFIDNQASAIRYTGKILIDLIPKIYDTKRIIRIEAKDNTIMNITIDPNAEEAFQKIPPQDGEIPTDNNQEVIDVIFNPNVGNYAVMSDVGPSFATRRQEAFNALTQIAAQNKEFMGIAGDILWKVADFPEAQVLAQRWRKIIPKNITGDGIDPAIEETMNQAAQQIEMQLGELAKLQKELDDKNRELAIKESAQELAWTKTGVQEIREDFKALTDRLTAVGNAGPGISVQQLQPIIRQVIAEIMQAGGPGADQPHEVDQLQGMDAGGEPIGLPTGPAGEVDAIPEIPGSRQAADGKIYAPNGQGWAEVIPPQVEGNA